MQRSIGIIGGGAGGMCAAIAASNAAREQGEELSVHLFERNARLGIKILISGGGKCNITHEGPVEDVLRDGFLQVNERRFLKSALYRFTNDDMLRLLEKHSLAWHARENGRIFPDSARAEDVLRVFEAELREARVLVHTRHHIGSLNSAEHGFVVRANGNDFAVDALILATGGTSYRKVGTTGDGLCFAELFGHTLVPQRAALAPIYLWRPPIQDLVGVAVRDAELLVTRDTKTLARHSGDVLLTHKGISGPATLDISREAALHFESGPITMKLNLLAMNDAMLREQVQEAQQSRQQQHVKTWLEQILPSRLAPFVLSQADIVDDRKWNALTREERGRLLHSLSAYDLGAVREIPIDRGEVTAGGVDLQEVSSKTMMSKRVAGLFFVGELLDIAGEIGGYNLQAAYSTGWVAGEEAVKFLSSRS